jgi:hypothetical protein
MTKNQKGLKPLTCRSFGAPACANSGEDNPIKCLSADVIQELANLIHDTTGILVRFTAG